MANATQKQQYKTTAIPQQSPHKIRTLFSALAGTIAVYLILSSLTVVWLNRTLTNTNSFVGTVGPLVEKPEIQKYVADTVTDQIVDNSPPNDLANQLLPSSAVKANPSPEMLKAQLKPVVNRSVLQIVQSQQFDTIWTSTLRNAHATFMEQLNSTTSDSLTLDLSPAINGVVNQMKLTQLKPVADQIGIKPGTGALNIKSANISRIHDYYKLFKVATVGIVVLTVAMIALSIWLSVHHGKTARRIFFSTGILALLQAILLEAPSIATFSGNNAAQQNAAKVLAQSLLHNLQVASLIVGLICLAAAAGSKLYVKFKR